MKIKTSLLLLLSFLTGCVELPLTDRRHFDPELEKRERELMNRKDFATGEERQMIEKDLDRIKNNYIYSPSKDDLFERLKQSSEPERDKVINDKIKKELERAYGDTLL